MQPLNKSWRIFKYMREVLLAKYGEVALKGLNKAQFENAMLKTI